MSMGGILKMISGEMDEYGGDMENVFKWTIDKNSIKR